MLMNKECCMPNALTALWNARQMAYRLARQSAQKRIIELDTKIVIF